MSSLGEIRHSSAINNIANTFYIYELHVGIVDINSLFVDTLEVLGDLTVDGATVLGTTLEVKGAVSHDTTLNQVGKLTYTYGTASSALY